MVHKKEKIDFDFDETCLHWSKYGNYYNKTIFCILHGRFLEILVTTVQARYAMMRGLKEYDKTYECFSDSLISGGGIQLPDKPTTDTLQSLFFNLKLIYTRLKVLGSNYIWR